MAFTCSPGRTTLCAIAAGYHRRQRKEHAGLIDCVRESAQSSRGLPLSPEAARTCVRARVRTTALGFWQASTKCDLADAADSAQESPNLFNKHQMARKPKASRALHEIWMAETKKDALAGPAAKSKVFSSTCSLAMICQPDEFVFTIASSSSESIFVPMMCSLSNCATSVSDSPRSPDRISILCCPSVGAAAWIA